MAGNIVAQLESLANSLDLVMGRIDTLEQLMRARSVTATATAHGGFSPDAHGEPELEEALRPAPSIASASQHPRHRTVTGSLVPREPLSVRQPTAEEFGVFKRTMAILNTGDVNYRDYASIMGPTTVDAEWGASHWWGMLNILLPRYNLHPPRRGILGPIQFIGWFAKPVPFSEAQAGLPEHMDDLRLDRRTWYPAVFSAWSDSEITVDTDGCIVPVGSVRMACLHILWMHTRAWWVHPSRIRGAVVIAFQ